MLKKQIQAIMLQVSTVCTGPVISLEALFQTCGETEQACLKKNVEDKKPTE